MIPFIDRFLDTHTKRYHLFLLIVLGMSALLIIPYIILAFLLLGLDSYDAVYALLRTPMIQMVYISRVVLDVISNANLSFFGIVYILIANVNWYEVCTLIALILAYPIFERKKIFTYVLILFFFQLFACCICVIFGAQAMSLSGAVIYLRMLGGVLCVVNILLFLLVGFYFMKQWKQYRQALQYDCIEVKEPMC